MERVTPLEIERSQFRTSFRGYERNAVRLTLQRAAREIEWLLSELKDQKKELESVYNELERYKQQEETLQETLKLAQRASDETRNNAQREAELILADAEREANHMKQIALEDASGERWQLEKMKHERRDFERRFRALLEEYMGHLEDRAHPALVNLESREAVEG
jgi:cell division initiation protein